MQMALTFSGAITRARRAWPRTIVQSLAQFGRALAAERRRRIGMRQLQGLDDRMLADIGLGRSEIEYASRARSRVALRSRDTTSASLRP